MDDDDGGDGGTPHPAPLSATDESRFSCGRRTDFAVIEGSVYGVVQPSRKLRADSRDISFLSPRRAMRDAHLLIALLGIGQQLQKHSVLAKAVTMQRETPGGGDTYLARGLARRVPGSAVPEA